MNHPPKFSVQTVNTEKIVRTEEGPFVFKATHCSTKNPPFSAFPSSWRPFF